MPDYLTKRNCLTKSGRVERFLSFIRVRRLFTQLPEQVRILPALILMRLALGLTGHLFLDTVGGMPASVLLVTSYLLANTGVRLTCSSRSHSKPSDCNIPELDAEFRHA